MEFRVLRSDVGVNNQDTDREGQKNLLKQVLQENMERKIRGELSPIKGRIQKFQSNLDDFLSQVNTSYEKLQDANEEIAKFVSSKHWPDKVEEWGEKEKRCYDKIKEWDEKVEGYQSKISACYDKIDEWDEEAKRWDKKVGEWSVWLSSRQLPGGLARLGRMEKPLKTFEQEVLETEHFVASKEPQLESEVLAFKETMEEISNMQQELLVESIVQLNLLDERS